MIATKHESLSSMFDEIALLHGVLRHPNIPALDHRGNAAGTHYVALRSSAFVDLETMLPIALASGGIQPAATVAFLDRVIGAVRSAHATPHPVTGAPICISAFAGTNVLVSDEGVCVIGWGYPTSEAERRVFLRDESVMHVSWEASFGARATPLGDLDAVGRYFHAILPATAMPPALIRALRGDTSEEHVAELVRLIAQLEDSAHARRPSDRSWKVYLDSLHRITTMLEVTADDALLRSELARLRERWLGTSGLCVARDGGWFSFRETRTDIDGRPSLSAILTSLATRRRDAPGAALDPAQLLAAGWPGERVALDAGRNRVRVAISTLRSMGLRELLLSRDDGYLLDPAIAITIE